MERIAKIVYERNKERELLTVVDVRKIYEIIIEKHDCKSINDVIFTRTELAKVASYYWQPYYKNGNILICMEKVLEYLEDHYTSAMNVKGCFFEGSKIDFYNWLYLGVIFHEFSHAMDYDRINKGRHDVCTEIADLSFDLVCNNKLYSNLYDYFPTEVRAYNQGNLDALKVYSMLPKEFVSDNDMAIYASNCLSKMLQFYTPIIHREQVESPIEHFVAGIGEISPDNNGVINILRDLISKTDDFSLYKRLMWGLPVTYSELCELHMMASALYSGDYFPFVKRLQKKKKTI